jgi:hypothetical protein
VAAPGRSHGQPRVGEGRDLQGPRGARAEHGRSKGADERVDRRMEGAGTLSRGAGEPHSLRAGADDGADPRQPATSSEEFLRCLRATGCRTAEASRPPFAVRQDDLGASPPRAALGRAHAESSREFLPAPRESLDQLENRNATAPAARRCASARLHGSLGGTVRHADPRTPRRRDPAHRVDGAAAVLDPSAAAVRRRPAGNRPGRLLQPVQPGEEEHPS